MRKLNTKNKIFILLFSLIIVGIVGLLVYSINLSEKNNNTTKIYTISTNSVVYDNNEVLLDTKQGGSLNKSWDSLYYYVDYEGNNYELGDRTVVYDKALENIHLFGDNHFVSSSGNITKNTDETIIENVSGGSFYKLDDRVYLIVANQIFNEDKTIYTSKYLIVNIDKQGNASFLNDVLNIKTINPMKLTFDNYVFDIANEKLIINKKEIDLKLISGSTNEYIPLEKKIEVEDPNMEAFINSYNQLVNDFTQYVNNTNMVIGSNNPVVNNTIITTPSGSNGATVGVTNKTNINKRVSLRGIVSYPSYLDVSYVVTDPEEKFQAVYLLVTGIRDGEMLSEKIILDKYNTVYRITGLNPNSEYTVSMGYVEVPDDGNKQLIDYVEDVINVRTSRVDASIKVNKILPGYVTCTFKMTEKYAIESGQLVLYADNAEIDRVSIKYIQALSDKGFTTKLKLEEGNIYEIRLEDAIYNDSEVDLNIRTKFTYQSLKSVE